MKEIKKEIVRHIGVISESTRGWQLELNMVRWDDGEPKLDLRVQVLHNGFVKNGLLLGSLQLFCEYSRN